MKRERPLTHDLCKSDHLATGRDASPRADHARREQHVLSASCTSSATATSIRVDSRPSDAIAIALRLDAPIFAAEVAARRSGVTRRTSPRATSSASAGLRPTRIVRAERRAAQGVSRAASPRGFRQVQSVIAARASASGAGDHPRAPRGASTAASSAGTRDGAAARRESVGRAPPRRTAIAPGRSTPCARRPNGTFSFRYQTSGDSSAVYFVSTSYGGVAYFTSPLRAAGRDAATTRSLTVFDTTSRPVAIKRRRPTPHRRTRRRQRAGVRSARCTISRTTAPSRAIARDSVTPVWSTHDSAPRRRAFSSTPAASLPPARFLRRGIDGRTLRAAQSRAFARSRSRTSCRRAHFRSPFRVERPTGVLEVLVQEPTARVQGPSLREMPPVNAEGRVFRRFLAQDVAGSAVLTIDVPEAVTTQRNKVYFAVGAVVLISMIATLIFAVRRAGPAPPRRPHRRNRQRRCWFARSRRSTRRSSTHRMQTSRRVSTTSVSARASSVSSPRRSRRSDSGPSEVVVPRATGSTTR